MFFIEDDEKGLTEKELILESDIQRQILDYLKYRHLDFWRQNNIGIPGRRFTGRKGVHDILGLYWPQYFPIALFVTIEVKIPGKKMTEDQTNFMVMVVKNGHLSFKADCLQTVIYSLKRLDSMLWEEWLKHVHKK